jgi:polyphosphate glucokinase
MDGLVGRLIEPLTVGTETSLAVSDAAHMPVGIGIPAATRGGTVLTAANIDSAWIGFPAEREMALVMSRSVAIGNDADVAGLAELRFGAGRRQRGTIIVLTIGTGVGSALFADGRLLPNTELGHLELNGGDAEVRVAESARDRLKLGWKEWASGFDDYLHLLERLFWPDLFILGGGASKRADNYLQYLSVKTPIVVATLKNNAGIVGGALIAHEKRSREAVRSSGEPIS